ncbi:hypothetical protein V6N11_031040 [Hibiscus sabdariffa]|uniref:Uncharacterized protein n=2 Tax=Hibiscus sabdariffa TaxID=183260 RepID=A0ABR2ACB6_9ROSI
MAAKLIRNDQSANHATYKRHPESSEIEVASSKFQTYQARTARTESSYDEEETPPRPTYTWFSKPGPIAYLHRISVDNHE